MHLPQIRICFGLNCSFRPFRVEGLRLQACILLCNLAAPLLMFLLIILEDFVHRRCLLLHRAGNRSSSNRTRALAAGASSL